MTASENSVTQWLGALRADDAVAAGKLWARYMDRLVRLARQRLADAPRRMADEEDVAIRAFDGFLRGVKENRFANLEDRDDLWQVLVMLTERRAVDQVRREIVRRKAVVGESGIGHAGEDDSVEVRIDGKMGPDPTPAFAAEMADNCRVMLAALDDPTLRDVAVWKMEGYTNQQIATRLGVVRRTVDRKLELIRQRWTECGFRNPG